MQRNTYTQEFKQQVIKEAIETGNCSIVARRYDVNPSVLARWVRDYNNKGIILSSSTSSNFLANPEAKQMEAENEKLKKLLGEKELENQILRDLIKKSNPHLLKKLK